MMEILQKLYSNPNFGLYLFAAIIILTILFFIILILALKDAKKTKKMQMVEDQKIETDNKEFKEEINNQITELAFTEENNNVSMDIPKEVVNETSTMEKEFVKVETPKSDVDDFRLSNVDVLPKEEKEEDLINFLETPSFEEDDFKTAILEQINVDELNEQKETTPEIINPFSVEEEKIIPEVTFEVPELKLDAEPEKEFKPFLEAVEIPEINLDNKVFENKEVEPVSIDIFSAVNDNIVKEEPKPIEKKVMPQQFSSVYVDTKKEPIVSSFEPMEDPFAKLPEIIEPTPVEEVGLPKFKDIPTPKPVMSNESVATNTSSVTKSLDDLVNEAFDN